MRWRAPQGRSRVFTAIGKGVFWIDDQSFNVLSVLNLPNTIISEQIMLVKGVKVLTNSGKKIVYNQRGNVVLEAESKDGQYVVVTE